jgi:hypothetical protein
MSKTKRTPREKAPTLPKRVESLEHSRSTHRMVLSGQHDKLKELVQSISDLESRLGDSSMPGPANSRLEQVEKTVYELRSRLNDYGVKLAGLHDSYHALTMSQPPKAAPVEVVPGPSAAQAHRLQQLESENRILRDGLEAMVTALGPLADGETAIGKIRRLVAGTQPRKQPDEKGPAEMVVVPDPKYTVLRRAFAACVAGRPDEERLLAKFDEFVISASGRRDGKFPVEGRWHFSPKAPGLCRVLVRWNSWGYEVCNA